MHDQLQALNTTICRIQQAGMLEKPKLAERALGEALGLFGEIVQRLERLERGGQTDGNPE